MSFTSEEVKKLPDEPCQPHHLAFPSRSFGKNAVVKRSFQISWFNRFPLIHYELEQDAAYCFVCCKAVTEGKVRLTGMSEASFLVKGFINWKDATRVLSRHESCDFHKTAASALSSKSNIADMLSSQVASEKKANHDYMLKVISSVRFLARQGLPLRGDGPLEQDSNFYQILKLRGEDCPLIKTFLEKKQLKYTSHEVQNELLAIMSTQILHDIAKEILSEKFFTVMIDEATDLSNTEQVVIVLRYVKDDLSVIESFIGLYQTDTIDAQSLVRLILDSLLRMNLTIQHCRGQCYDGASNMRGSRNGVAKILMDEEPRAVYTHCYDHSLNLAVGDSIKRCIVMQSSLDVVFEISKLIKKSPKRDAIFQRLKDEIAVDTPGF